jgi:hypothetical protein
MQLTPQSVTNRLRQLDQELGGVVAALESAENDAILKRGAFDLAHSKAFLSAQGSMDLRKHQALVDTHELRMAADVADAVVRHLRRRIDQIKTSIECGRSMNSALKAEIGLVGAVQP